jgi:hypothetical protein
MHINPPNAFTYANHLSPGRVVLGWVAVDSIARTKVPDVIPNF